MKASATKRICVFGPPKSGKTQLVSGLASQYNLIWFDLEQGYSTLLKLPAESQARIELIPIPDSKNYPIAIETILKVVTGAALEICVEHGKVSCPLCKKSEAEVTRVCLNELNPEKDIVVIDSMTQLANSAMNFLMKGREDTAKAEWEDYRKQGALMERFLSTLQNSKYNVVCITHEAEVEQEDGRKKIVPVAGTTNFSRNTARYFDEVIYAELKNKKHVLGSSTCYANNILTGSRTDTVLDGKENGSLLSIFNSEVTEIKSNGQKALGALAAMRIRKGDLNGIT